MRMTDTDTQRWLRIAELFDAAVELPMPAREAFIAAHCASDAALATRLRAMLAADADAQDANFLGKPAIAEAAVNWDFDGDDYTPGSRRFGPYCLQRPLGRGGMGEVHLAERVDGGFEQRVALKLLPAPTSGLLRRFRQERQILARLEHPHIAHLLDGGVGESGIPYFVMEYVEGVPITRYVTDHALDPRATLQLFLKVCDAVQYAHRNLVVHRDIKPSNILVDADGTPKLLDFGIAKVLETTDRDATQTRARAFTPDYAAPEQIRGEAVTTATDVYALGVVLYELLTGTRPYKLRRDQVLEQAILTVEPTAPSHAVNRVGNDAQPRALARRGRLLRGDLDRIVLTALAKEPARRYVSVEAFAGDIRRFLDGRSVTARGDGTAYRLRKFILRNKVGAAVAAVVALALFAATAVSLGQARRAHAEAASARASQKFMLNVFTQAEAWSNAGHQPTALDLAKASLDKIDIELADEPLARYDMYMGLQRLFSVADDVRLAAVAAQRAMDTARIFPQPDKERLQRAQMSLAYALSYNGDYDGAERVLATLIAEKPTYDEIRIGILSLQSSLARERGRREDHLRLALATQALGIELARSDKERRASLWHVTDALDSGGDYRTLLPLVDAYDSRGEALYAPDAAVHASDAVWLLHVASELDAPQAAFALFARALERERRIFGTSDYTFDTLMQGGRVARAAGHSANALAELAEAQENLQRLHPDPIETASHESTLGLVLLDRHDKQAAAHLSAAAAIYRKVGGEHDPRLLFMRAALARVSANSDTLEELRAIHTEQQQRHWREAPETAVWIAETALAEGATEEAAVVLRGALQQLDIQGRSVTVTAFISHGLLARTQARGIDADSEAQLALALAVALFGDDSAQATEAAQAPAFANKDAAAARIERARRRATQFDRPGLRLVDFARATLDHADQADAAAADARQTNSNGLHPFP